MLTENIIADDKYTRLYFGPEAEVMIGSCYEGECRNEMYFCLGEGLLSGTNDGIRASMIVFMELVMRRHCEVEKDSHDIVLRSLTVDHIATPTSNFIRGLSSIMYQNNNSFFMKVLLHNKENLVMSGTAVWSFDN